MHILSEDNVPCVLTTLNSQFASNASNSACWNGLHPVIPSNFTNKSFRFLEQLGWNFHQTLWHTPQPICNLIGPTTWEELVYEQQDFHSPRPLCYPGL